MQKDERGVVQEALGLEGAPRSAVIYGPDGSPYLDSWANGGIALGALGDGVRFERRTLNSSVRHLECRVWIDGVSDDPNAGFGRTLFLACCACAVELGCWPGGAG